MDTEFFNDPRSSNYIINILIPGRLGIFFKGFFEMYSTDFLNGRNRFKSLFEYVTILFVLTISLAAIFKGYSWPIDLVFLPSLVVAHLLQVLIELPEHVDCNSESRTVSENTRTLTTNSFMEWVTNFNNWHIEHHSFPNVDFRFLERKSSVQQAVGYVEFYHSFLRAKK